MVLCWWIVVLNKDEKSLYEAISLFGLVEQFDLFKEVDIAFFFSFYSYFFLTMFILICFQRWDNILRCNLLIGLVHHFGLLKEVNISFSFFLCLLSSSQNSPKHCSSLYSITLCNGPKPCLTRLWYLSLISQTTIHWQV